MKREAVEESESAIAMLLRKAESVMQDDWACVSQYSALMDKLMEAHTLPVKVRVRTNIGIK